MRRFFLGALAYVYYNLFVSEQGAHTLQWLSREWSNVTLSGVLDAVLDSERWARVFNAADQGKVVQIVLAAFACKYIGNFFRKRVERDEMQEQAEAPEMSREMSRLSKRMVEQEANAKTVRFQKAGGSAKKK